MALFIRGALGRKTFICLHHRIPVADPNGNLKDHIHLSV